MRILPSSSCGFGSSPASSAAVRIEAARSLGADRDPTAARARALDEYRQAQQRDADQPESHVNLGVLHAQLGETEQAEAAYRRAIAVGPWFLPAYVNLADALASRGRDADAERVLREGLAQEPGSPMLLHALGLALVRGGRSAQALAALEAAASSAPEEPRFAYVLGVALFSQGSSERAIEILQTAHERWPDDRSILLALATMHRDMGKLDEALRHARRLESLAGRHDEAVSHFAVALEKLDRLHFRVAAARARVQFAQALVDGAPSPARPPPQRPSSRRGM